SRFHFCLSPLFPYTTLPRPNSKLFPYTRLFRSNSKIASASGLLGRVRASGKISCTSPETSVKRFLEFGSPGAWLIGLGNYQKYRSEEHTSNSSHLGISYAVFCLKKKNKYNKMYI